MIGSNELGGIYDGYEGYRKTEPAELERVLRSGIVALDTNVLLDLYRYAKGSREQVFEALKAIAPRLFMPAQVQKEFWRNRDQVIRNVVAKNSVAGLQEARKKALATLSEWGRQTMSTAYADDLKKDLESAFQQVITKVEPGGSGLNLRAASKDVKDDLVLKHLEELFAGRVGRPFTRERLAELVAEGRARFARRMPPGYMDADKIDQSEEGTGDFLIWEELVLRAVAEGRDILFVTRDLKEDWWRHDAVNNPIGPRVELVNEMRDRAGVAFLLVAPQELLQAVSEEFPDVEMSESTLDNAERLTEEAEPDVPVPWTAEMWETLLSRLAELGWPSRVAVLREAAKDPKGYLTRQRVYEINDFKTERLLTGFTKPVTGAVLDLVASGELPAGLEPALRARYLGPGKAVGFLVPPSVVAAAEHAEEQTD